MNIKIKGTNQYTKKMTIKSNYKMYKINYEKLGKMIYKIN